MPYTALQTLGWLARRNKWERMYAYPLHRGNGGRCRLRAVMATTITRTKHKRQCVARKGRKILVIKRTGPGNSMNWFAENPPCGLLDCAKCGFFIRECVSQIEQTHCQLTE